MSNFYDLINNITNNITHLDLNEENHMENHMENSFVDQINSLSFKEYDTNETYYDYDRTEHMMNTEEMNTEEIDTYDNSPYVYFGTPNIYCSIHFDDEDFISNRYLIPIEIKKRMKIYNSIDEYSENYAIGNGVLLDYTSYSDDPDMYYCKILHIYKYVETYYKELKHLQPVERIQHLSVDFLHWVNNIVCILQEVINETSLKNEEFISLANIYFKELMYGLNIIIKQLQLMLNYYKSLYLMEEKHIKLFFKIVNNMCVIIIFMKLSML